MTIAEIFNTMRDRIASNPAKVGNFTGSYQFDLGGEGGGTFHAAFNNGSYDIGEGALENPGCTVIMSAADFQALVAGKLNPTAAFMSGKLKIKGDMGLAMKLQQLIG